MGKKVVKKIYTSLEALFDLRQGTLTYIDVDFATAVTSEKEYFTREVDVFSTEKLAKNGTPMGALRKEIFDAVYKKHKDQILKNSLMSKVILFIADLYRQFSKQAILTPFLSSVELDINIYPFKLSEEEVSTLLECVVELMGGACTVNIIDLSESDLNVTYVKENYVAMVMYNYVDWFNLHTEDIQKRSLTQVGLYVPKLNSIRKLTKEEMDEFKKKKLTPFEFMVNALAPFITIQFLPISTYCANIPSNLDEYAVPTL